MIDPENDEDLHVMKEIAREISEYRQDCIDQMHDEIVKECDEIVDSGFDLALGSGRGAWWAEGN